MRSLLLGALMLLAGAAGAVPKTTHFFFDPVRLSSGTLPEGVIVSTKSIPGLVELLGGGTIYTSTPLQGDGSLGDPATLDPTENFQSQGIWSLEGNGANKEGLNLDYSGSGGPSAPNPGAIWYDSSLQSYWGRVSGMDVELVSGRRLVKIPALKGTAGTINKMEAVYVTGWDNANMVVEVELADNDNPAAFPPLGLADESFTNTTMGYVLISGIMLNINTNSFDESAPVWLDSTPGAMTKVRPSGISERVAVMGKVLKKNPATGQIIVRVNYADEAFPNVVPVDIYVTGRINGVLDQGVYTNVQLQSLVCPALPCRAWSSTDNDMYTATQASVAGAYRNQRLGTTP